MSSHTLRPLFRRSTLAAVAWIALVRPLLAGGALLICQSGPTNRVETTTLPVPGVMLPIIPSASWPTSVRIGPDAMTYVVEPGDTVPAKRVKRYFPDGKLDNSFTLPGSLVLQSPCDVAFNPGASEMFISDTDASVIYPVYLKNGTGIGYSSPPIPALGPTYLLFRNNTLYIAEGDEIDTWTYGEPGVSQFIAPGLGGLSHAGQFAFAGNSLYVASTDTDQVLEYLFNGQKFLGVFAGPGGGVLSAPIGLAIDPNPGGKLFVASSLTNTIRSYALTGGDPGTVACAALPDLQGLCAAVPETAPFPLRAGELVTTYCPYPSTGTPDTNQPSVILVDERFGGPTGENWPANFFWNEHASATNVWNYQNLGSVFGIAMDDGPAVSIFVTASTAYGDFGTKTFGFDPATNQYGHGGEVYKLGGCDGFVHLWMTSGSGAVNTNQLYVDLTNTGTNPGLGDVCFDSLHQQFFVSDFEDGKIYRVKDVGNRGIIQSVDDPFASDALDNTPGFAARGERVWALHVHRALEFPYGILLFSVWLRDSTNEGGVNHQTEAWPTTTWGPLPAGYAANNTIWAWPITVTGSLSVFGPFLWRILPHLNDTNPGNGGDLGYSNPVSDITSFGNSIFVAERTFGHGDFGRLEDGASAHHARVLVTPWTSGLSNAWSYAYRVGDSPYPIASDPTPPGYGLGWNCAGGVAMGPIRPRVYATGDALHFPHNFPSPGSDYIYGLQGIPYGGNSALAAPYLGKTSKLIDLDHDIASYDKSQEGDVEYVYVNSDTRGCGVSTGGHTGNGKAQ